MNELLINIAFRQREELGSLLPQKSLQRDKSAELIRQLKSPLIKVILGPRRSGKSTLALLALKNHSFSYFNLEDEALPLGIKGEDVLSALTSVYGQTDYIFFDEIQNLENWEPFLNRLLRNGKNLIVTGSNSQLLSEELASALTGRHVAIELLPFSFKELQSIGTNNPELNYEGYLLSGGFPQVALGAVEAKDYLPTLWDSIILKDIAKRYRVRNISGLRSLLSLYLASLSSVFSGRSLERGLNRQVSIASIQKFLTYAREAYLIADLQRFNAKTRLRIASDRKAYIVDNGWYTSKHVRLSEDTSKLLENSVFIELWRRGFKPNVDLFSYATKKSYEVDFYLRDGHKSLELIQVSAFIGAQKTLERELRALEEAAEETNCKKACIITLKEERKIALNNIEIDVIPAWKWALEAGLK